MIFGALLKLCEWLSLRFAARLWLLMDEPIRKLPHVEKVKEHQEPLSTLTNQSVKSRNATHGDR